MGWLSKRSVRLSTRRGGRAEVGGASVNGRGLSGKTRLACKLLNLCAVGELANC
jgi:hypothetical protein